MDIDIGIGMRIQLYSFAQCKSPLKLKVLYILVKHVIVNKVVTKLEAYDFVRKRFAKISRRKFLDDFKRATAQDCCRKPL